MQRLTLFAVLALCAIAWLALFFTAQDLWRRRDRIDRRDVAVAVGLFVVALALRWWLPEHTLVHENKHAYRMHPYLPLDAGAEREGILFGHVVLFKLWAYLGPIGKDAMFEMNTFFSAAAVPGMYALGRAIYEERLAAWSAACLLLLQPLALVMAPTEESLVSATGLLLAGMPLLWLGAREGLAAPIVAGACLVGLGASAREVTLPLALLAPMVLFAATRPGERPPWRLGAVAAAILTASLLPRTIRIVTAMMTPGEHRGFVGLPRLPVKLAEGGPKLDDLWVGWQPPYIPMWMGFLGLVSIAALTIHAVRHPAARRTALVAVGGYLPAQAAGGVVYSGWFPTNLRHQHFAMAMMMLPMGWLFAQTARVAVLGRGRGAVPWLLAPALGAATLVAWRGYELDAPLVEEYRFFREAILSLPPEGRAVVLPRGPAKIDHLPEELFWSLQPRWLTVPAAARRALSKPDEKRPTYLFLDRTCFMNTACIEEPLACRSPEKQDALGLVPTPYGRMHPHCVEALKGAPWVEVARREIVRREPREYDEPSVDPVVTIAVLKWGAGDAR